MRKHVSQDGGFPHSKNVPFLFVAGVQGHPSGSGWSVASVCLCSQIYGKTKVKSVPGPGYNLVFIFGLILQSRISSVVKVR